MTEKRFTLDLEANADLPIIVDNKSGKWWFIRDTVGNCEILCDLLNSLCDENEQLRQRIAFFEKQADEFEQYTAQTIQNMIADYRCGE